LLVHWRLGFLSLISGAETKGEGGVFYWRGSFKLTPKKDDMREYDRNLS